MKRRVKNQSYIKWAMVFLAVIMIGSIFSIFDLSVNNGDEIITVSVQYYISGVFYQPENYSLNSDALLHNLLVDNIGAVLQSDGDINRVGQLQNNFLTGDYWQVFVNNVFTRDVYTVLSDNDVVLLYYGQKVNIFNIIIGLNVSGYLTNNSISVQEGSSINSVLNNFADTSVVDNVLYCFIGECGDEFLNWSVKLNSVLVQDFNTLLSDDDFLLFELG